MQAPPKVPHHLPSDLFYTLLLGYVTCKKYSADEAGGFPSWTGIVTSQALWETNSLRYGCTVQFSTELDQGYWSREHRQHPQGSTASQVVWGQSPALTFIAASKTKVKVAIVASTFE